MFNYLLRLILCALLVFIVIKVSSFIENKITETSGWKTDLLVLTTFIAIIIITIVGFYSLFKLFLYIFVY